jgi:hypothetical protein
MNEWCLASIKTNARLRWEWDFAVASPETQKEGDLRVVTMTSVSISSPLLLQVVAVGHDSLSILHVRCMRRKE